MSDPARDELVRFTCLCGKELEVPPEVAGSKMECPWCTHEVIAPARSGETALPAPEPAPAPPEAEFARCPECAGPCAGETCTLCGIRALPRAEFKLLPPCERQGVVRPEMADWIVRKVAWLVRRHGLPEMLERRLVLPTDQFFPGVWEPTREDLEDLLRRVQSYAGLSDLSLHLVLHPMDASRPVALGWKARGQPTVCTRFPRRKGDAYTLPIDLDLFGDRFGLVASIAHEMGHLYLLERLKLRDSLPPDHELLTDLVTVFLGLGILTCEGFERGFLAQRELSFALALDARLRGADDRAILPHLGVNAKEYFTRSSAFFADHPGMVGAVRDGTPLP